MSAEAKSEGPSAAFILFIVFLVLKLTGVIGWSWWWVTAPLWAGLAIFVGAGLIVGAVAWIYLTLRSRRDIKRKLRANAAKRRATV